MKIYTRTGDSGKTALIGGERVPKCDLRVEAYGNVDELTAHIALLRDRLDVTEAGFVPLRDDLARILNTLMSVQALLAVGKGGEGKIAELDGSQVAFLEERIDRLTETLPPLHSFTIPGGHPLVSQAHVCRTVCRRAERAAIRAEQEYPVSPSAMIYLNRLSDYLYTLGRKLTDLLRVEELPWIP